VSGRGEAIDGAVESALHDAQHRRWPRRSPTNLRHPGRARHRPRLDASRRQAHGDGARRTGRINRAELTVVGVFHTGLREIDDALFRIPLAQGRNCSAATASN